MKLSEMVAGAFRGLNAEIEKLRAAISAHRCGDCGGSPAAPLGPDDWDCPRCRGLRLALTPPASAPAAGQKGEPATPEKVKNG